MHSLAKSIFISKHSSEVDPYRSRFENLGYSVVSHSFLSFSPLEFDIQHDYDVLFFGSPRAVIFFRASQAISSTKLIACVGGKTAELLESLGHEVSFVGRKSGDPKVVGEEFKTWLGTSVPLNARVLFPVSDRSLRTISSVIDEGQKEEVVVYLTEVKSRVVEACDVYVFTSPSNVEGYFAENGILENSQVIAWGKSTEEALIEAGVHVQKCLEKSSFEELIHSFQST